MTTIMTGYANEVRFPSVQKLNGYGYAYSSSILKIKFS